MSHNVLGYSYRSQIVRVVKKTRDNWLIETADGKKWVDKRELVLITKTGDGLKIGRV